MGINESCLSSCEGICWSLLDFVELNAYLFLVGTALLQAWDIGSSETTVSGLVL